MITKSGINVVSYVHTADGLVRFDALTEKQKKEAATQLKLNYLNELYRGKATFTKAD